MNPLIAHVRWSPDGGRFGVRYRTVARPDRRELTTAHVTVDVDAAGQVVDVDLAGLPLPDVDRLARYAAARSRPPSPFGVALDRDACSLWLHLSPAARADRMCGAAQVWLSYAAGALAEVEAVLVRRCMPAESAFRGPWPGDPARRRLVVCDLDGTLLDPHGTLSAGTQAALAAVRAAGHVLVIATGRPVRDVRPVVAALGGDVISVCGNGSVVHDGTRDQLLGYHPVGGADARAVLDGVRRLVPGARFGAEIGLDLVLEEGFALHPALCAGAARVARLEEVVGTDGVGKIIVQAPGNPLDYWGAVVAALPPACAATVSGESFCEVTRSDVDKATAVLELAARYGIDRADVVAFGDMPNDLSMMLHAGWSVAVANAHPTILAAADEVTGSNVDDGVARWLERRLLAGAATLTGGPR